MVADSRVAVIILNWNSFSDTFDCLKSLGEIESEKFDVFLVDNDSQDDSFEKLKGHIDGGEFNFNIDLIQTGENLGFAGGNNVAIKKAYEMGYKYFWLLNNDAIATCNSLTPLVNELKNNLDVGIVGSKIFYYESDLLWYAGGQVDLSTGRVKHIGLRDMDGKEYDHKKEVDFANGCSLAFRREILETVGYMDEEYFLYYEETDWNTRVRKSGYKILYIPESVVYHKVSASSGGENNLSPMVYYYNIRNAFIFVIKNHEGSYIKAYLYMFYRIIKETVKTIFLKNYAYSKKSRVLKVLLAGNDAIKIKRKITKGI